MKQVYINCSLSNGSSVVFVTSDGSVFDNYDEQYECVGFWHPGGDKLRDEWVREHTILASQLKKAYSGTNLEFSNEEAVISGSEDQNDTVGSAVDIDATVEEPAEPESTVEPETESEPTEPDPTEPDPTEPDPTEPDPEAESESAKPESESVMTEPESTVDTEPEPEPVEPATTESEPAVIAEPEPAVAAELGGRELLVSLGVPSRCFAEMLSSGLDTSEKLLAHEDLSQIKGIGEKTRDEILALLRKGQ